MSSVDRSMLFKMLVQFFESCTIKSPKRLREYEDSKSARLGTLYVHCLDGVATIEELYDHTSKMYTQDFSLHSRIRAWNIGEFITNEDRVVLSEYLRSEYIASYKETNKYILNMAGEPYINISDPSKCDTLFEVEGKDADILGKKMFIHEISEKDNPSTYNYYFKQINSDNVDALLKDYPTERYLHYIKAPIPYGVSRSRPDFAILQYDSGVFSEDYTQKLLDTYYKSRAYHLAVQRSEYITESEYFDEHFFTKLFYIVLSNMLVGVFDEIVEGKIESPEIRSMYLDSYKCGDLVTHMSTDMIDVVIKALPYLNHIKGSDQVLAYILNLAGIDTSDMKQHYIVKVYPDRENEIVTEFVDTPLETFDLKVIPVPFGEDPSKYINNITNNVLEDYDSFTSSDVTWGGPRERDRKDLKDTIKRIKMNYMLSKYITVEYEFNDVSIGYKFSMFISTLTKVLARDGVNPIRKTSFVNTKIKHSGSLITLPCALAMIRYLMDIYGGGDGTIERDDESRIQGINIDASIEEFRTLTINSPLGPVPITSVLKDHQITFIEEIISLIGVPIISIGEFSDVFVLALDYYRKFNALVRYSDSGALHRALLTAKDYLFAPTNAVDIYSKFNKYSEYILDADFELYNSLSTILGDIEDPTLEVIPTYITILMESIIATLRNSEFNSYAESIKLSNSQVTEGSTNNTFDEGIASLLEYFKSYKLMVRTVRPLFSLTNETMDFQNSYTDVSSKGNGKVQDWLEYKEDVATKQTCGLNSHMKVHDDVGILTRGVRFEENFVIPGEAFRDTFPVEDTITNTSKCAVKDFISYDEDMKTTSKGDYINDARTVTENVIVTPKQ